MPLSSTGSELLATLAPNLGHAGLFVLDEQGQVVIAFGADGVGTRGAGEHFDTAVPADRSLRIALPGGGNLLVTFASADAALLRVVEAMLQAFAQREQLEQDIESMNSSSTQLLEQFSLLSDTLPRLSGLTSDEEVATAGMRAALSATGVERGVFVRHQPETDHCEVVAYLELDPRDGKVHERPYPGNEDLVQCAGVVKEALAREESYVLLTVPEGGTLGEPGSLESLARRELVGVPVGYVAGDRRVTPGVMLLMDSAVGGWNTRENLGSPECQVALAFAGMIGAVLGARKIAALNKELSMAQTIQAQILPQSAATVSGFDLAGGYRTCGEVGGDYFDYVTLQDGRTMVVVADVSGHNLASGMVMVSGRATLRTLATKLSDPAQLFDELAASMYQDLTRTERFITAASVTLRPDDARVEVVNAGHNDLMLYRAADREVELLPSDDTILGFLPDSTHGRRVLKLLPGDFLFVYTDGITETLGADGEMYGEERLAQVLCDHANGDAEAILARVFEDVAVYRGSGDRGDDVTAVVIKAGHRLEGEP